MSRGDCIVVLGAVTLAIAGCRGGEVAATDAEVDHAYTAIDEHPSATTVVDAPRAIGGGPASDGHYTPGSALRVLSDAWCERARGCGGSTQSDCDRQAAHEHGDALAQCDSGVRAPELSDCASQIRSTSCDAGVAIVETCTAAALCVAQ
jgi:hypothetical protein